ncbi:hypothetical protein D9758_001185 [Tetrapyrgos nigripes]|uniref:Endoglucanase n=1 Tax=Tetrapyrgos nigripes TaxID=182062 RepID=A0A8H5GS87_9AGAR|nr:hypothetical protein D9758_001185 [Tetrapyrgos nigripes]
MFGLSFLLAAACFHTVASQLSLPESPWLPPDASKGAQPSNGSSPNSQWSNLLGNLLYFYEAQRSGVLPSTNRVSWRNDSCTNDGSDVGLDLSGGYYDAGDYIKATFPLSFTLMSICWGATDFGKGYDMANQTAYLDDMLRWGLDWLIKTHPSNNTLYIEVADTGIDNAYWGGDQHIPEPRPSFQINNTHPGTDAAAAASAAFASCSNLYAGRGFNRGQAYQPPASLTNSSYADTLLNHSQQLYSFAINASGGWLKYQKSVPIVTDSYASSGYGDELTIAALFLSAATNSSSYYQDALDYYKQFSLSGQDAVFNWDSKTPGVYVLFAQLAQAGYEFASGELSSRQMECERYFDNIVNNKSKATLTPGGLIFYDGDSNSATLNPALNAAMLLARYAPIASSSEKTTAYLARVNPNSPSNPHSATASGGDDILNIDTVPLHEAYVLYGAVVGGPDPTDKFFDIRNDWVESEVALDYNAPMLTLAAMHVLNDTNDPFYTSLQAGGYEPVKPQGQPCDDAIQDGCAASGGHHMSTGVKIALIVVLVVVGSVILGLLSYYLWVVRKRRQGKTG